jgi:FkbM family methyltransferase
MRKTLNLTAYVGQFTRWLQSLSPEKPVGITTLSRRFYPLLPDYEGIITLEDGLCMRIDTRQAPERGIFFAGDRHRAVTTVMRQRVHPGAYCMDIGANIGFYTLKLAQFAGASGRVAAFEANPALIKRIQENIALNHIDNVDTVPKAVTQTEGQAQFYVAANSELSSLDYDEHAQEKLTVEATTIDSYVASAAWPRLDFIKLDIEGYDCHALLGGRESLTRFRPFIVLEYQYHSQNSAAEEAFTLLRELGYTMQGLILRSGQRVPFDWQTPYHKDIHHVNVVCKPPH